MFQNYMESASTRKAITAAAIAAVLLLAAVLFLWWKWDYTPGRSVLWSKRFAAGIEQVHPDPAWKNIFVVDFNNNLFCLDERGKQRWCAQILPGRAMQADIGFSSAGDLLVVSGVVRADRYNLDGKLLWHFNSKTDWLAAPTGKIAAGPAELAIFDSYHVYGLNLDGQVVWVYDGYQPDEIHRLLRRSSNNEFYFVDKDAGFVVLNADGTLKWRYQLEYDWAGLECCTESAGDYFVESFKVYGKCGRTEDAVLVRLSSSGEPLWAVHEVLSNIAAPVITGDAVYLALQDDGLISYSLDGIERWRIMSGLIMPGMSAAPDSASIYARTSNWDRMLRLRMNTGGLRRILFDAYQFIARTGDRQPFLHVDANGNVIFERAVPAGHWIWQSGGPDGKALEGGPRNRLLMTRWKR